MEKSVIEANTCTICNKTFSSKWSVNRHIDSAHHKKRYLCQLCNKIFAREDYLSLHLKTVHEGNGSRKKSRLKKRSKRRPKATKCPDSTTIFNSVSYKNETSIHDDNTNFGADEGNMDIEIVSVPIKSDDEDSILSVNWEDTLQQIRQTTDRHHVEDRPFNRFTDINRIKQHNSEQMNTIRENSHRENMPYDELLIPAEEAVDEDLQIVPLTEAANDDCISINSDDDGESKSRPNEPDKSKSNRTRGENGVPPESQSKEPDNQADKLNSNRNRGENDVLVDSNVFDLLKRRTLDSSDEDRMFLLSILSDFKKVLPQNKLTVKIKIAQAISDGS